MKRKDSIEDWIGLAEGRNGGAVSRPCDVQQPATVPYNARLHGVGTYGHNGFGIYGQGGIYGHYDPYAHVKPVVDTTGIMFDGDTHEWPAVIIYASEPYEIDHTDDTPVVSVVESPKTRAVACAPVDACTRGYLQSRFDTVSEDLKATLEDLLKTAKAAVPANELAAIAAVKARISAAREIIETAARVMRPTYDTVGPILVDGPGEEPVEAQPELLAPSA
jgi:hypothetical protein